MSYSKHCNNSTNRAREPEHERELEHPDPIVENQIRRYRRHQALAGRRMFGGVPGSGDLDGYNGDRIMPQSPEAQQRQADDILEQRLLDDSD
jgi:hypothetical protein